MRILLPVLLLLALILPRWAYADLPTNAKIYLPLLQTTQAELWPDHPFPATIAAQIEKETCISITHSKCWSRHSKLQTSREYGFGFGQFTVAYNADGSERFNTWRDLRNQNSTELKDWTWDNRLDPTLLMKAMVLYDRRLFEMFEAKSDDTMQVLMFAYAGYNGGPYGTLKEIRMCDATANCNPLRWEGKGGVLGVESTSNKSRKPWNGYGDSAYSINRKYVKAILYERVGRYAPFYE